MANPVRDARARRRLTQIQLGLLAGVDPATIGKAERGGSISILKKQAIADALNLERRDLFPEPEEATA